MDKTNKFRVITAVYNGEKYIEKCLISIMEQDYKNYDITVIDDCSDDRTIEIARNYPVKIYKNESHSWSGFTGMIPIIKTFDTEDIVVEVDGDDFLYCNDVLSCLNEVYQRDIWLTYGQFMPINRTYKGYSHSFGSIENNENFGREKCFVTTRNYRKSDVWMTSHLKTWKKWLWDKINEEDFKDEDGNYFITAGDCASMYPMLEMAGEEHIEFIDKILYVYNNLNPCSDEKMIEKFHKDSNFIKNKPSYASISRII